MIAQISKHSYCTGVSNKSDVICAKVFSVFILKSSTITSTIQNKLICNIVTYPAPISNWCCTVLREVTDTRRSLLFALDKLNFWLNQTGLAHLHYQFRINVAHCAMHSPYRGQPERPGTLGGQLSLHSISSIFDQIKLASTSLMLTSSSVPISKWRCTLTQSLKAIVMTRGTRSWWWWGWWC